MKYYFIVLDKKNKTAQLVESRSCERTTELYVAGVLKHADFRLHWIGADPLSADALAACPKKYAKFTRIGGLL